MNEMIRKGVIAGVLATTITGTGMYLYGTMNGGASDIRKTTIVNQENKVRIDYKEIILDELIEQKQIVIASNKMRIPFVQTEEHWFGKKTQEIEFSAIGRFIVDLDKLNSQDIMVDETSKTVTIYMTKPSKIVELLEDETKFGETKKGLLVWGDIEYTLEDPNIAYTSEIFYFKWINPILIFNTNINNTQYIEINTDNNAYLCSDNHSN